MAGARVPSPPLIDDEPGAERHATWLELFFDLVFVVAVSQLAGDLAHHPDGEGFLRFGALFVPLWWGWVGYAFFATRFECDDAVTRILWLAGMLAAAAMAVNVNGAFDRHAVGFALSYAALRSVLIVLYLRIRTRVAGARSLSTFLAAGFSLGTALWYASVFVPEPARFWLWGAGMTIEILVPLIGNQVLARTPIHPTHLPERFGLFMIIVLGESVAGVVAGTADASWHLASGLVAAGGFVAAASLWWSYFDFAGWAAQCGLLTSDRSGPLARDVYSYGHFPVAVSLALIGVGTELAILDTPRGSLAAATRWALFGGAALYLLGIAIIYSGMTKRVSAGLWPPRLAAVALTLALAGFGGGLAPLVAVAALALTLVAHVTLEIRRGRSGMGLPRVVLPQAVRGEQASEPFSGSSS